MRVFLSVLILIFSLQSLTKADDIRDFEIEGMSIGDSLLDYYSINKIEKYFKSRGSSTSYTDDSFLYVSIPLNGKNFEKIGIHHKKNDKDYIILGLSGIIFFDDFQECLDKQIEIESSISSLLNNFNKKKYNIDKNQTNGERKIIAIEFSNKNKDTIGIDCTDWSKKMKFTDNLRLDIITKELNIWLNTKAYD